ncbi:MAG: hypothetical protein KKA28_17935 [Planctomycetes bacterium]|nr:hypothetical protein [Planctomycetota bacterium]MCG2682493.1 hypothetical protein [Planctomycetales bacterium]
MSTSIIRRHGFYRRVFATFLGLALIGIVPASGGETIYPLEPGRPQLRQDARIGNADSEEARALARQRMELQRLSEVGRGNYVPLRLKRPNERRVEKFETSFEECAPGRNSGANEWSAFGAIGNMDFNAMGRELWVRYPAFELEFRLQDGGAVIEPGQLDSFRLGLVNNRLPAIWGGWRHGDLLYKVSVMTVPSPQCGNFDLYKLEVQNPTAGPLPSKLLVAVNGPPDMHVKDGVLRGLGENAFLIADPSVANKLETRDAGWCDKRAKAYLGRGEPVIKTYRLGFDGLPVVYRFKAEAGKKYVVYLAGTQPWLPGENLKAPRRAGDLVAEYRVEGCAPKTFDWSNWFVAKDKNKPPCVGFENARDVDGDGAIEVSAGVAASSRLRHTCLSAVWVFPEGTKSDKPDSVAGGAMKDKCIRFIDVGITPEQGTTNQDYDKSDVSFARMRLDYAETIPPGRTKTYWLRVPPVHRREPVSMGYVAHAFRDVLPGEAVPPFGPEQVKALRELDPLAAERQVADFWATFLAPAAQYKVPDPILNDIYLSRLATRAVLEVNLNKELSYEFCSPFFYFDQSYRDGCYMALAWDMAGMHDHAAQLLRVYCKDVKDVPKGPIYFSGTPIQLGMLENGQWNTRPSQWDTQGQNIWALVQHYKLSGDRPWLEKTAYPYIRRGAMWIVNSRHKHMAEIKDSKDPRYGLIEPGAMEVMEAEVGKGMHMYYLNAFSVLGLREAADAAKAVGAEDDARLFAAEGLDLKHCLHQSFQQTFKRKGLYEGHLWFGVEPVGVGLYGFWAHNCLVWPCRAIDPHDPMLTATLRHMDWMSDNWGGGMHSESWVNVDLTYSEVQNFSFPLIGVDRAIGRLVQGERDRALDYFCAYTDTAGGTLSWGEGYNNLIARGDQPHNWADMCWLILFRDLFAFEDDASLWISPALFRRWHEPGQRVAVSKLPTYFGDLDLRIEPRPDGRVIDYTIRITPKGDQKTRALERIVLYPRIPGGRAIAKVTVDGKELREFTRDTVIYAAPPRDAEIRVSVETQRW